MAKLALDDVDRDAFTGELERMRMAQLMRREPAPHPGAGGQPAELGADGGASLWSSARGAVDDA